MRSWINELKLKMDVLKDAYKDIDRAAEDAGNKVIARRMVKAYGAKAFTDNDEPQDRTLLLFPQYANDPLGFFANVLKFRCTPAQARIAQSILEPPYRTLAISANAQGKSAVSARIAIWWLMTRSPVKIITTAPTDNQVKQVLWNEIRGEMKRVFPQIRLGVKSYERGPNDFMVGITAKDATSFHGRHGSNQLFIFDEATGIEPEFWEATESMFKGDGHAWLCLFNPTDLQAQVYQEYIQASRDAKIPKWHVVKMSAIDHPNIAYELRGLPAPVPNAMRLEQFERMLKGYSQLVGGNPDLSRDILWPPEWAKEYCAKTDQQPKWYRPGPLAEARLLARFPRSGSNVVWSDGDWMLACREGLPPLDIPMHEIPQIGIDVAREGDDMTAMHVRCGPVSLAHEEQNGLKETETAGWARNVARQMAAWYNKENRFYGSPTIDEFMIPIKIDDAPTGGGIIDLLAEAGYNVYGIKSQRRAMMQRDYPDRRSEVWFTVAEVCRMELMDLSRLPESTREELRKQAMAATWKFDQIGRRRVEEKLGMKKVLGRSPDGMDALNLAYIDVCGLTEAPEVIESRADPLTQMNSSPPNNNSPIDKAKETAQQLLGSIRIGGGESPNPISLSNPND